jgi:hypothetical protein
MEISFSRYFWLGVFFTRYGTDAGTIPVPKGASRSSQWNGIRSCSKKHDWLDMFNKSTIVLSRDVPGTSSEKKIGTESEITTTLRNYHVIGT